MPITLSDTIDDLLLREHKIQGALIRSPPFASTNLRDTG